MLCKRQSKGATANTMVQQESHQIRLFWVLILHSCFFNTLIYSDCPFRQYGANCTFTCYCIGNLTCDDFGNNCIDCDPNYFGPHCNSGRPRLSNPPTLISSDCVSATITWKNFNSSVDFGVQPTSYNVFYMTSTNNYPTFYTSVNNDGNASFVVTISSLDASSQYSFAILPLVGFYSGGKFVYNDQGLMSNYSQSTPSCSFNNVTTSSTTTSVPGTISISSTTLTSTSGTTMTTSATSATVSTTITTTTTTTAATTSSLTNNPTSTTASVLTPPQLLTASSFNSTSIVVSWIPPNGSSANGIIKYTVEYRVTASTNVVQAQVSGSSFSVTLSGLSPQTFYTIKIQCNYPGVDGPWSSSVNVSTTASSTELAILIRDVTLAAMKNQSLQLQWQPPNNTLKPIMFYQVNATRIVNLVPSDTSVFTPLMINVTDTSISFPNLPPASQFAVTIQGVYNDSSLTAKQTVLLWTYSLSFKDGDVADVRIQSSDSNTISVIVPPVTNYTGGPVTEYVVTYYKTPANTTRARRSIPGIPTDSSVVFNGSQIPSSALIIGNGQSLSPGLSNPALSPNTSYTVVLIAGSTVDGNTVYGKSSGVAASTAVSSSGITGGIIAAIVISVILLIILLLLLIWWLSRRKREPGYARHSELWKEKIDHRYSDKQALPGGVLAETHENPRFFTNWSCAEDVYGPRYLILDPKYEPSDLRVDQFLSLPETKGVSFQEEFQSLPQGLQQPHEVAKARVNAFKNYQANRWTIPYDHTRVSLERPPKSDQFYYINASYIDSYCRRKAYIIAQSPFDEVTVEDFWYMIYQENVAQLVMLCECKENGLLACAKYWPKFHHDVEDNDGMTNSRESQNSQWYGSMLVTIEREDIYARFTMRYFSVARKTSKDDYPSLSLRQSVVQYHFHDWPQGDSNYVPQSPLSFIDMHTKICVNKQIQDGPVVVHGPLDGSRSGVFVAFDSLLQQAVRENCVNVFKYCNAMLKQRPNLIPSATHYMFLYDLLGEALLVCHNLVNLNVREYYRLVTSVNPRSQQTYLKEQHCLLERYTPIMQPMVENHDGLLPNQRGRVRFPTTIPLEEYRVKLSSGHFINALYIDGLHEIDDYILTDTPMASTVNDFWTMVSERRVSIIVDMQPNCYEMEGVVPYWPERANTDQRTYGQISVQTRKVEKILDDRLLIRHLRVKSGDVNSRGHTVKQYQFLDQWDVHNKIPESRVGMVQLITHTRNERQRGPILVHCLDGATCSGLFLLAHLSATKMHYDHFVDLFHIAKAVKIRRCQVLTYQEQYKFLFRFLWDWVRANMREELEQELRSQHLAGHLPQELLESSYTYAKAPVTHQHEEDHAAALNITGDLVSMAPESGDEMKPTLLDSVHYAYFDKVAHRNLSIA